MKLLAGKYHTSLEVLNIVEVTEVAHERTSLFTAGVHKRNKNFKPNMWQNRLTTKAKDSTSLVKEVPKGVRACVLPSDPRQKGIAEVALAKAWKKGIDGRKIPIPIDI